MRLDYLVTGGAGFIGTAVGNALVSQNARPPHIGTASRIVAIDNLHPQIHPRPVRPKSLDQRIDLKVGDVCDAAHWDTFFRDNRPDVVVHLAAETGTGQSLDLATRHANVNVTGTATMLDAMSRADVRPRHLVLASSRAVYGEGAWLDPADRAIFYPASRNRAQLEGGQFAISAPSGALATPLPQSSSVVRPIPNSVYGATKLAQEHILSAWANAYGVPLSILRFQNVYGVGQSPFNSYCGIVGLFHRQAAAGQTLSVYEDGRIGRDFIYIDDAVSAMLAALATPPRNTQIIDVGSGVAISIHDAANYIAELYGAPSPKVTQAFRHGDVRWAVADSTQMAEQFGVTAKVDFSDGNRRLSDWLFQSGYITRSRI
jgi:dTDP-L-rhamnose 4-epimerase